MHKTIAALVAVAALASPALAAEVKFKATLSGAPTADPDGSGKAEFTIDQDKGQVCYTLEVKDIDTPRAAHIHGPTGAPVLPLTAPAEGKAQGCAPATGELMAALIAKPGDYYVNVHNAAFPGGAIRGSLSK
jgi:hypothetical protein